MEHTEELLLGLSAVVVLGIGAQWLAWRIRIPSILLLLTAGFVVGPIGGWLNPDELFGDLLFPVVSLSVAVVLFEGSLSLRLSELEGTAASLWSLLSIGVIVTWAVITVAAWGVLGFDFPTALLLGAMLVVTGPTVVGPMLRHIRPVGKVSPIARWEGIVVDPIGAVLAVLIFETIEPLRTSHFDVAASEAAIGLVKTIAIGTLLGGASAWALAAFLKRHWIPDHLQSPVTLMIVIVSFLASNLLQHEAGLLTVTVMGVILANQKAVVIKHILEFKENLTILLVSGLFILLSARVHLSDFTSMGWQGGVFVAIVLLVARPAAVFLSMAKSDLSFNEKLFLSWLAPRGIVAAAVASVFALRMGESGAGLVPATFLVIVSTVVVYGLTAFPLARRLGLASQDPQGVLIASAHAGARAIAHALQSADFRVVLVDTNHANIRAARMEGLSTYYANILSDHAMENLDLGGIGRFMAMTRNDVTNAMAAQHFSEDFGRSKVYQLAAGKTGERTDVADHHMHGRLLFGEDATYSYLDERFAAGAIVKTTTITDEFDLAAFRERYGESAVILFTISEAGRLTVVTTDHPVEAKPGHTVLAIVDAIGDAVDDDRSDENVG